jgi:hypothetical protein
LCPLERGARFIVPSREAQHFREVEKRLDLHEEGIGRVQ